MALTEVTFSTNTYVVDRGDLGVVADTVVSSHTLFVTIPNPSQVQAGIEYGRQSSQTGLLTGGGASTYSRGRVVNA